jgi:hypothetical protein
MERQLIAWYREMVTQAMDSKNPRALEIAALPDQIRGYELIKETSIAKAKARAAELLAEEPVLTV